MRDSARALLTAQLKNTRVKSRSLQKADGQSPQRAHYMCSPTKKTHLLLLEGGVCTWYEYEAYPLENTKFRNPVKSIW